MAYPFPYDFSGQTAVITGGARGFGLDFATALCTFGARAIITDLDSGAGAAAVAGLRAAGHKAEFRHLDVREKEDHAALAAEVCADFGTLDLWINNAGIARHGPSETLSEANWTQPLEIMLSGTFYGAQAAAGQMLGQGHGRIINIASVNGLVAQAGRAAYVSAKSAVIRLTEVLAAEWSSRGIVVNGLAPAVIMTDLVRASLADGSARMESYVARSPMKRVGRSEELVAALFFLASPFAKSINGHTLKVDGAWCADSFL